MDTHWFATNIKPVNGVNELTEEQMELFEGFEIDSKHITPSFSHDVYGSIIEEVTHIDLLIKDKVTRRDIVELVEGLEVLEYSTEWYGIYHFFKTCLENNLTISRDW